MNPDARIRILIADDHVLVREGIRNFLATEPDLQIVGEAGDADGAVALARAQAPDVAVLDLRMPGGGVAATRRIREVSTATQVVILTSFEDDEGVRGAIEAGAISYVLKDVDADARAETVRRAARGEATLHPRVAARLLHGMRAGSGNAVSAALSPREREVLLLIGEGLDNREIAERLAIGKKTVKTHVSNLLAKLGVSDRTRAAVWAWREGMVRRP